MVFHSLANAEWKLVGLLTALKYEKGKNKCRKKKSDFDIARVAVKKMVPE